MVAKSSESWENRSVSVVMNTDVDIETVERERLKKHETAWRGERELLSNPCPTTRIRECQALAPLTSVCLLLFNRFSTAKTFKRTFVYGSCARNTHDVERSGHFRVAPCPPQTWRSRSCVPLYVLHKRLGVPPQFPAKNGDAT